MKRRLLVILAALCAFTGAQAASLRYCDNPQPISAAQQDKLLRLSEVVKKELERNGQAVALLSRSGLDLDRFGQRYSHAGFSLAHAGIPWAVRQLYYACDERRPRLFDQGIAGFVSGTDNPELGYVSLVFLPAEESDDIERVVLDKQQALNLLAPVYSANAYPFSTRYQNCNQWVIEMLAAAWGSLPAPAAGEDARAPAQRWLQDHDYQPSVFSVGRFMSWASRFVRWVHTDDHPTQDRAARRYRVTLPASIEAFVHATVSAATRVELCHDNRHIVIHRGWDAIADRCEPGAQDTVIDY